VHVSVQLVHSGLLHSAMVELTGHVEHSVPFKKYPHKHASHPLHPIVKQLGIAAGFSIHVSFSYLPHGHISTH